MGKLDYRVLTTKGNSYIIIDTDEIPILDVKKIDSAYSKVVNENESMSLFKRKVKKHDYLQGYIGFNIRSSEGLDGETDGSVAYILGTNSENMQFLPSNKMDRMPRARRIFKLHVSDSARSLDDIIEITNMMMFGFGRWNEEVMTSPSPFKIPTGAS